MSAKAKKKNSTRPYIVAGYLIILIAFVGLGGWATTAKIDSAVVAQGNIVLEGNRKAIQHLEGGIIVEILVEEADLVEKNDVLILLSDVKSRSNVEVFSKRIKISRAIEARLVAEIALADTIQISDALKNDSSREIQSIVVDQFKLFDSRRKILTFKKDILNNRIEQLKGQIKGLKIQEDAFSRRHKIQFDRMERLREGVKSGVIKKNRVAEVQDGVIEIEADLGRIITEIAKTKNTMGETTLQILQTTQEYTTRASMEIKDVKSEINEFTERLIVAEDVLRRTAIVSPVTGSVQNLKVHTTGGVIRPGDVLMEIVPKNEKFIVNAKISPLDIDNIKVGLLTEVRFSSFNSRNAPTLFGTIETISNDIIAPTQQGQQPYFLARIDVSKSDIPDTIRDKLTPGMPADILISTGERTVTSYLISPLEDAIRKSFREE